MKRRERTEILVHCPITFLKKWATYFEEQQKIQCIKEASNALVMIKMRESAQHSLFYLGEMLVSEAKVMYNDNIGIGIIQGTAFEEAYYLAVLDVVCQGGFMGVDTFYEALYIEKEKQQQQKQMHIQKILKTRVNFETMDI